MLVTPRETSNTVVSGHQRPSFYLRAAAIIVRDGHVLIQRHVGGVNWALPGGRIELQETAAEALAREIREEVHRAAEVGPLRLVIENFFRGEKDPVHSIGFYHEVTLERPLPFHKADIVHRVQDGRFEVEFRWAQIRRSELERLDLRPAVLCGLLENLPEGISHRVSRTV